MTLPDGFLSRPFAHRALHDAAAGRPENSRAAVSAAVAAGYGIEIDVQLSADGVAMVFHDDALDRLTAEHGPVRQRDAAALGAIPLRSGTEGIPTLTEVLDLVAGQVPLLIEVKDQDGALGPDVGPLERAVAAALAGYAGPVAVMSFNPHAVAAMARQAPSVPRGLTTCAFAPADWPTVPPARCKALAAIPDFDRIGAAFVSHDRTDLGNPALRALRARGVPVLCWTVRSEPEAAAALHDADAITFEGFAA